MLCLLAAACSAKGPGAFSLFLVGLLWPPYLICGHVLSDNVTIGCRDRKCQRHVQFRRLWRRLPDTSYVSELHHDRYSSKLSRVKMDKKPRSWSKQESMCPKRMTIKKTLTNKWNWTDWNSNMDDIYTTRRGSNDDINMHNQRNDGKETTSAMQSSRKKPISYRVTFTKF